MAQLLLFFGVRIMNYEDHDKGVALIVIGSLAFLPGSYASFQLYGAWKEWPGYDYANVGGLFRGCCSSARRLTFFPVSSTARFHLTTTECSDRRAGVSREWAATVLAMSEVQ